MTNMNANVPQNYFMCITVVGLTFMHVPGLFYYLLLRWLVIFYTMVNLVDL